jgi:hypothetical protein
MTLERDFNHHLRTSFLVKHLGKVKEEATALF